MAARGIQRHTTFMLLNSLLAKAIAEKWNAETLAKEANCATITAKKFLNSKANALSAQTDRKLEISGGRFWTVLQRGVCLEMNDYEKLVTIRERGGVLTPDQDKALDKHLARMKAIASMLRPATGNADPSEKPANAKLSLR